MESRRVANDQPDLPIDGAGRIRRLGARGWMCAFEARDGLARAPTEITLHSLPPGGIMLAPALLRWGSEAAPCGEEARVMDVLTATGASLFEGFSMLWETLWALVLGFT
ncbi:MAG TPA: hypothetical protein VHU91_09135, partial [Mycobacteriales bacterium]|nr:hypothetical protein [Mycobacteriales bacterium]